MSTMVPTKIISSFATAPFEVSLAMATGWTDYWLGAIGRRSTPLDVAGDLAEWWRVTTQRNEPKWAHSHKVVKTWPVARLLDYSAARPKAKVATLVLPPQAGHSSSIVDFARDQSQMVTIRDCGLDRLFTLDWTPATEESKDFSIDDYLAIMDESIDSLGGKANLVGDCQGGWLATIYAALHPDKTNSLTIGGAPIDYHAGNGVILEWIDVMGGRTDITAYRDMVKANNGLYAGSNQVTGFKMMQPAGEIERIWGLLPQINDTEAVRRYTEFTDWFEWTHDISGAFYLWIVEELFAGNKLIKGTLQIGGEYVDLAKIDCQVNLLAGTQDHITPADQVWALADYISTPKDQVARELVDAGHLGLFMGHTSLRNHWTTLMANVLEISK